MTIKQETASLISKKLSSSRMKIGGAEILLILPVLVLALSGCLHLEQTVVLEDDGMVTVSSQYSLPIEYFRVMEKSREQIDSWQDRPGGEMPFWPWNEAAVREFVKENHAELIVYTKNVTEEWSHVSIVCRGKFTDLSKTGGVLPSLEIEHSAESGLTAIRMQLVNGDESARAELSSEERAQLTALYKGFKMSFTLKVPGRIAETTGNRVGDNTVSWTFDGDRDLGFLEAPPEIMVKFEDDNDLFK